MNSLVKIIGVLSWAIRPPSRRRPVEKRRSAGSGDLGLGLGLDDRQALGDDAIAYFLAVDAQINRRLYADPYAIAATRSVYAGYCDDDILTDEDAFVGFPRENKHFGLLLLTPAPPPSGSNRTSAARRVVFLV
jgi:hypothetical protein